MSRPRGTPKWKVQAEYPHVVALRVPEAGFGIRLNRMHALCIERGMDYATTSQRAGLTATLEFRFKSEADAAAFRAFIDAGDATPQHNPP